MKIETQPRDDQQVKLIVEIEPETLEKFRRGAARKIAQETRIPGFRPGKAPFDIVRRLVGDEALLKQAVHDMVDDIYPKALKESGIKPGGPGDLEEIVSYDPPKFAFIVPLEPEVVLGDYLSIRKEYTPPTITDEDVENVIGNLQKRFGTAEPVERPAQEGDVVYITLQGHLTQTEEEDKRVFDETGVPILIGSHDSEEEEYPYPGFDRELLGLSAGEGKTLLHTFGPESLEEALRGKEVQMQATVESVKVLNLPELNDEFCQNLGYKNIEEMRHSIRDRLARERASEYDNGYDLDLVDQIVAISTIKYPPQFLQSEIDDMVESFEKNLERRKLDLATYLKTLKKTREQFVAEDIEPMAKKRIARAFVVEKIIESEKVSLTQDELNRAVSQRIDQIEDYESGSKKKRKTLNRSNVNALAMNTANSLLNQRAIELLRTIATGNYQVIQPAEPTATDETTQTETSSAEPVPAGEETQPETITAETEIPAETQTNA